MFTRSPLGATLAIGTVLTELLEVLLKRNVITRDDLDAILERSVATVSEKPNIASHGDALAILKEVIKRFDKSST
jgi:hypothetical protein